MSAFRVALLLALSAAGGCTLIVGDVASQCPAGNLWCEGFEDGTAGFMLAGESGAQFAISDTMAHAGRHALVLTDEASGGVGVAPSPAIATAAMNHFYLRAYVYLGPVSFNQVSILEINNGAGGGILVTLQDSDATSPVTLALAQAGTPLDDVAGVQLGKGAWHCVEMEVNGGFEVSVDGQVGLAATKPVAVTATAPRLELVTMVGASTDHREIYFDDAVVSTAPIGCD